MPAPHLGFIAAAYGVTGLVILATIAAVVLDYRAQKRAVARLSDQVAASASGEGA